MPIDYSKFDNIVDSDDEEEQPKRPQRSGSGETADGAKEAAVASSVVQDASEHGRPLDDAPTVELPDGAFIQYYKENMTAPQRMQTLVQLWNSADQQERVEFLRHLIDIINNPQISNRIKGGQEILKDLDTNFYRGVTYPETWLTDFQENMSTTDKKTCFEKLFKALDHSERGLVLGTLM